jgi:hypothetical protein
MVHRGAASGSLPAAAELLATLARIDPVTALHVLAELPRAIDYERVPPSHRARLRRLLKGEPAPPAMLRIGDRYLPDAWATRPGGALGIAIATHNRSAAIALCLEALARQPGISDIPIVVVDSASRLDEAASIERVCRLYRNVVHGRLEEPGVSWTRNAALPALAGCDRDDALPSGDWPRSSRRAWPSWIRAAPLSRAVSTRPGRVVKGLWAHSLGQA